jgi:hypothetical protein
VKGLFTASADSLFAVGKREELSDQAKREKEKEKLPKDKKILKRRAAGRAG